MSAIPASSPALSVDFTDYQSAFLDHLKLSDYPDCLRSTVERMRDLSKTKPFVDESVVLGRGIYGVVYLGGYQSKAAGVVACAVKVFSNRALFKREISMYWKCAGVSAAIPLHGFFAYKRLNFNAIVLDYISGLNLSDHLKQCESRLKIPAEIREDTIEFARQLFHFLSEIQIPAPNRKMGLIHLDLSPDNLFWANRKLVVIDFGMMAETGNLTDPVAGKKEYRAPEIYLNQISESNRVSVEVPRYNASMDVWSAGAIIHLLATRSFLVFTHPEIPATHGQFELATLVGRIGLPPVEVVRSSVAADKFFVLEGEVEVALKPELAKFGPRSSLVKAHQTPSSCPELLSLLQQIFVWNPADRITAEQALKQPLFFKK